MKDEQHKLKTILHDMVESQQCECVGIDIFDARSGKVVRIYIDTPEGVEHAHCERVSRAVIEYLDGCEESGSPWFPEKYFVEVSSPGLERPLFTIAHYQRFAGERVMIHAKGKKKMEGALVSCDDQGEIALLTDDNDTIRFTFDDIKKANLVYVLEKGVKKGSGDKKKSKKTKRK